MTNRDLQVNARAQAEKPKRASRGFPKRSVPWFGNPIVGRRNARLHRLKRKGLLPPGDKASLRAAAAAATTGITRKP